MDKNGINMIEEILSHLRFADGIAPIDDRMDNIIKLDELYITFLDSKLKISLK